MTSKANNNMICICTDSLFIVQEYVRFLRRWQIASLFFSQTSLKSKRDNYSLWVNEEEYSGKTKDKKFVDEEAQLTGLLSSAKTLIKNLEVSCETNEQLLQANERLLGFVG